MKISVITPSHNPKYLQELEESLINQSYDNWEWILLLNNGCEYTPKNNDQRIKIIKSEVESISVGAWKKMACSHTTGDVIAEVDHDDFLTYDCLEEVAKAYKEDPEIGFVYSKTIYIQENGNFIPYDKIHGWEYDYYNWKGENLITMKELPLYPGNLGYIVYSPNHIRTWKKDIYDEIGGHNESLQVCDDHDLMIRLYQKTKFKYIDKPLYFYRITGENTWLKNSKKIGILSNALYEKNIEKLCLRYCEIKDLKDLILHNDDVDNIKNIKSNSMGLIVFNTPLKRNDNTVTFLKEIHRILAPGGMFLCEYEHSEEFCDDLSLHQFIYEKNQTNRSHSIDPNIFWFRDRNVKSLRLGDKTKIYFHVMKDNFKNQKRLEERGIKEVQWDGDKLNRNTGWNGLENYMKSIRDGFDIDPKTALEFGVEYGYSSLIFSQLFKNVIGVDTFEGDKHSGFRNVYEETKNRFKNTNVDIIKSDFRDFINENNNIYDLIHIDIVHTYEDTYECAEWAVQHSKVVILHDTISFPDINRVCIDLANKHGLEYYNIEKYNGLGILYNPKFENKSDSKIVNKNINIFYHCYAVNDWKERFEKTYNLIEKSELINEVSSIFVGFDGSDVDYFKKFDKVVLIKNKGEKFTGENYTLSVLYDYAKKNVGYSLYLHGKGVTHKKNELINWYDGHKTHKNVNIFENTYSWFEYLLYYNIELWKDCISRLNEGYDCVGTEYLKEYKHYGGNFWWANNKHIKKLSTPQNISRNECENWCTHTDEPKIYNFMNTKIDLYLNKIERKDYQLKPLEMENVSIYDCFTFFNELDLLEIRLNYLNDVVDYFVLVEADKTHSGEDKPYYYEENKERFKDFHHKIIHIKKVLNTEGLKFEKSNFENRYDGGDSWILENEQRNAISEGLINTKDDDIILIGDLDEIPKKDLILEYKTLKSDGMNTFVLRNHMYFLNNAADITTGLLNANWWGTCIFRNKNLTTPQKMRDARYHNLDSTTPIYKAGWHFTFLGGVDRVLYKTKSFAHSEYHNENYLNKKKMLEYINEGKDFIYEDIKYEFIDIKEHKEDYPDYLVDNLDKYTHLIKPIKREKVYDCFTFFNELDLLEIRLNYLNDTVDYFVLVESDKTFSGKDKPYYYEKNKERFKDFHHKIIHIKTSPNTEGMTFEKAEYYNPNDNFWKLENEQRNSILLGLTECDDEDIVIISDLDEIPKKETIKKYLIENNGKAVLFKQQLHKYFINNRVLKTDDNYCEWFGSGIVKKKNMILPQDIRNLRFICSENFDDNNNLWLDDGGWHFTFLGGVDRIIYKIKSWAHSEYNNEECLDKSKIEYDIYHSSDPKLKYELININDHKNEYPDYLVNNLDNYRHLMKKTQKDYENDLKNGFDDHLIDVYKKHIKKDSTIIDAGSYVGGHSLLFSQLGKLVYSFEPVENSYDKMIDTFKKEGVRNVLPFNLGLSNIEEIKNSAYINDIDVDYVNATLHFDSSKEIKERKYENQKEYKLTTIDSLNLECLDFIKIDVEGYELKVLMGGLNTIKKHKPTIVLECWNFYLEHFNFLLDLGYAVERINEGKPDYLFTPHKKIKPKIVLFMGYAPSILDDKNGGSEIMAYKLCQSLKNDYDIHVFGVHHDDEIVDGVKYKNISRLKKFQEENEIEILLISRYIYYFIEFEVTAKKTYIWIHDYYFMAYHNFNFIENWGKDLILQNDHKIDGYICLTQWHKKFIHSYYGMDINKIHIIGNAIDTKNWNKPNQNIKNRFIWVSRHERGLKNLLRIFPKIQEKYPDSELFIYGPHDDENYFNDNMDIINSSDKIHYGGIIENEKLIQEFQKSNFWFYPTEFAETYCISALEAQMSGCIPIASDYAALNETIDNRGVLLSFNEKVGVDDEYEKNALKKIFDLIEDTKKQEEYRKLGIEWASKQTFEERKKEWLKLFNEPNNEGEYVKDLVSVIIPYDKDRGYLKHAIESVKNQTHKNIELIVVNDNENKSVLVNRGFKQSKGEYIRFLDEDDYLPPDSIEKSVNAIKNTDFDLVHGNARLIKNDKEIGIWRPLEGCQTYEYALLRRSHCLNNMSVLYKRKVFNEIGLYDENLISAQDLEFFVRCYKNKNIKLKYLNDVLINYRHHDNQISRSKNDELRKNQLNEFWEREINEFNKKPKPILCFFVGYAPFIIENRDGWGGSELTIKQLSENLTFWYDVYVFGAGYEHTKHNDVKYLNTNTLREFQERNEIDIMIIARYLYYFIEFPITANKTYLWAHDYNFLPFHNFKTLEDRGQYLIDNYDNQIDGYVALTHWHKNILSKSHNIDKDKIHIIGNAIDTSKWFGDVEKVRNRFIWTSSPDRGLNHLLYLFSTITERYPDSELYIYGHEVESYQINWDIINNNPNIHYLGKRPNDEIIKMFRSSEYWFYPTDYYDTFNISALEAQMSKTICITSNMGGIAETVGDRGILIDYKGDEFFDYSSTNGVDDDYKKRALDALFNLMDDEELKTKYKNKGYEWAKQQHWYNKLAEWHILFNNNNNKKTGDNKMRFHILGIFYTKTTKEFTPDPFTQQTRLICKMLTELGHEVYHYGNEGSDPICTEHISVASSELFDEVYGHVNWKKDYFLTYLDNKLVAEFNKNAINEINERKQKNDFLLCPYGTGHKQIADNAGKDMIIVEPDIGYTGVFAPHKVFTTYSLMHQIYGRDGIDIKKTPPFYDAVIPHSFDLDDYTYSEEKGDYYFFMGRDTTLKGLEVAIKTVEAIGGWLIVAGQGEPPFKSDVMTHIGVVDAKQRAEWMSKAIATFVPTLYLEKFGMVVVESLLCGTPVITTDFGSFPELVPHGKVGYRCRTLKEFVIAAKNIKNIKPRDCREYAEANFSIERVSKMFQHYFTNLYGLYTGNDWYSLNTNIDDIDWLKKKI